MSIQTTDYLLIARGSDHYKTPVQELYDSLPYATPQDKGTVQFADVAEIVAGSAGYAVDAAHFKEFRDSLVATYGPGAGLGVTIRATSPTVVNIGDLWLDTSLASPMLKVFDGTNWVATGVAIATKTSLGVVQPGDSLEIDANGVLNIASFTTFPALP